MAKQTDAGNAKGPVIIALVCFVLLSLILGVLFYMETDKSAQAKTAAAEAATKQKSAEDATAKSRIENRTLKVLLGTATPEERTELASANKGDVEAAYRSLMTEITKQANEAIQNEQRQRFVGQSFPLTANELFRWDSPEQPPSRSLLNAAAENYARRLANDRVMATEKQGLDKAKEQLNAMSNKLDGLVQTYDKEVKAIPDKVVAETKKLRDDMDAFKANFNKLGEEQRKTTSDYQAKKDQAELDRQRADDRTKSMKNNLDRLQESVEAIVDPFQYDRPQGKIIRRYADNLVDIDLGSSDNLRTGTTFAVFPSDTPTRGMAARNRPVRDRDGRTTVRPVPKGKLEVVEILGPNLAQCRLTEEESQVRERVLAGDLLYNAIWRKGQSEHVVLFGIFDLNGDGKDDIQSLVRDLKSSGVVVDAYYDLAQMKWVGEFTSQTTFAVEGYYPTVTASEGNREAKIKILGAIQAAKDKAKQAGVRVLRPRDFFPRIGYAANLNVSEDAINQAATAYVRILGSAPATGETPMGGTPPAGGAEQPMKN